LLPALWVADAEAAEEEAEEEDELAALELDTALELLADAAEEDVEATEAEEEATELTELVAVVAAPAEEDEEPVAVLVGAALLEEPLEELPPAAA